MCHCAMPAGSCHICWLQDHPLSPTTGPCRTHASRQQHTRHSPPGSLRLWTLLQHCHWRWASSELWRDVMRVCCAPLPSHRSAPLELAYDLLAADVLQCAIVRSILCSRHALHAAGAQKGQRLTAVQAACLAQTLAGCANDGLGSEMKARCRVACSSAGSCRLSWQALRQPPFTRACYLRRRLHATCLSALTFPMLCTILEHACASQQPTSSDAMSWLSSTYSQMCTLCLR